MRFKHLFCRHHFSLIATHKVVQEQLYKCTDCDSYFVYHYGIGLGYRTLKIDEKEWIKIK